MAVLPEVRPHYGKLKLLIDGQMVESETEKYLPVMNPAKDEVIAEVPLATKEEVDRAVEAAVNAFEKWKELPVPERVKYIYRLRQVFLDHYEELARICTQNHGKVIDEARGGMRRTIENIETACSIAYTLAKGEQLDQISRGIDEMLVREPLGVFAIVGPFNFPLLAPFWFVPYALALGCTVVVKPSEICPLQPAWAFELIKDIFPPGVVNVVHGGAEVVQRLIEHPDVVGIAFVGSTRVGRIVYEAAGKHGKRALCQAGAKNYVVIMPDADFEKAVPACLSSFFGNTGQRCLSGGALVTVGEAYDKFVPKFVEAASKIRLGYGLDERAEMGPLTTKKGKERVLGYIEKGLEEGAKLLLDGRDAKVPDYPNGYWLGPTIFTDVTPDMTIAREEIFGPVCPIIRAENLDEVIEWINTKTIYGNAASIFTSSGRVARQFRRGVKAGNIGINIGIPAPMAFFPFGGWKQSFFGVLHGQIDCVDFFTDKKIIIERWW